MPDSFPVAGVTVFCNEFDRLLTFREYLLQCREELSEHIIVDNNSSAEFKTELLRTFSGLSKILYLDKNMGVTGANNAGILHLLQNTDAAAVFILVNDVEMQPGAVTSMKNALSADKHIGIVGPVLVKRDRMTIEEVGGITDKINFTVIKLFEGKPFPTEVSDQTEVDFICGGAYMVKREVFEKAGILDEKLFMYCDETEFNHRVQKFGWKLFIIGSAVAYHMHPGSISADKPGPVYYNTRNQFYIIKKHRGTFAFIIFSIRKMISAPIQVLRYNRKGMHELAAAFVRGTLAGIFLRMNKADSYKLWNS